MRTRLVVGIRGKRLSLLRWYGCVTLYQGCHNTTCRFDTHGERSHVQEKQILHCLMLVTFQDGSLNGSTVGNRFIGVHRIAELFTIEVVLEQILYFWYTG